MLITVFTPTYNRAHTIVRTFESLKFQNFKDFEWLVVDDGSTDNTEQLVKNFTVDVDFPIKYIKQPNGGKHTAHNTALKYAQGELFFTVDSDDWLTPNSLESIAGMHFKLNENEKCAGVLALKQYPSGKILGNPFSHEDCFYTIRHIEAMHEGGERSIVLKTDIAQLFPFPVIEGERFMGESVVYDRIDENHTFYISNDILTVCEYQADGLSSNPQRLMVQNPCGYAIYYSQRIDLSHSLKDRFGASLRYGAFRSLTPKNKRQLCKYCGKHRLFVALTALFFSQTVKAFYKRKARR